MFIIAGIVAILMIGCIFAYAIGFFVFHITMTKAVLQVIGEGRKFATLPVVGGAVAVLFCGLGLSWTFVSTIQVTPITVTVMLPALILGAMLFAPIVTSTVLMRVKSPLWQKVRDSGTICAVAAAALAVLIFVRITVLAYW